MKPLLLIHLLSLLILLFQPTSAIDFIFNGFNSSDLLFYGSATIESRIVSLTNQTNFTVGRVLYRTKIQTKKPNSPDVYPFSTSFIFSMAPYRNVLAGHGFVFLFVPFTDFKGATAAEHLGLFNRTTDGNPSSHVFGIEFDVFKNQEFNDIDNNHVGIDVNSLTSNSSHAAGYWPDDITIDDEKLFKKLKLNNGENYQVWIDYKDSLINVSMALAENEDMDAYLLEKMNSYDLWSNYSQSFGYSSFTTHPTFEEIRQGNSSSMSLSWSNTTVQGR
ncbi:hypothetical protein QYF36_005692 [Acer negundo]|nr:hypothetical protein QYF36_005692 [Acer negundo]